MAVVARYLLDTSVWARIDCRPSQAPAARSSVRDRGDLDDDLEILYSARSPASYAATRGERDLALELLAIEQPTLDRALGVQAALAERGEHRGASLPDLVIAATAEHAQVVVLHYDADYDLIATITDQPVEWVVPRGSVP